QGEVHETAEPLKYDDDATLAETLLNIKRSTTKDKGKGIMQKTELPKKTKKREMIHNTPRTQYSAVTQFGGVTSQQGEVHETTEPLKYDDDATLAETLLNIKRSTTKDKRKGIMQKTELPKKTKKREMIQLSLDEELAQKLHAEELAKETTRQEQEKYNLKKDLELQKQLDQREEDVDKGNQTQDIDWNDPEVLRYHALQNRAFSKAEVRKNMCTYLKNHRGYKQSYFKGMKYEDIRPIFERVWDQIHTFVPKDSEIKKEVMKRSGFHLQQESVSPFGMDLLHPVVDDS
nr:hypothetical protein [Tanacetum cinerariifolium]